MIGSTTRTRWWTVSLLAVAAVAAGAVMRANACGDPAPALATSDDPDAAKAAIADLRARGPAGLAALMKRCARDLDAHRAGVPRTADEAAKWKRIAAALDAVAGQKDAAASGLYWYTDVEQAKAAAKREGKPILSLRLLGRLDEEFSCANSRFFRTVLYADEEVAKALRERFVLHWKSVRPVPKVTIDMGDGRVICRTVTGNSIHYVLDADGRPVDALPGLYGAKAFLRGLDAAAALERGLRECQGEEARQALLARWHRDRVRHVERAWANDLASLRPGGPGTSVPGAGANAPHVLPAQKNPAALRAAPLARSKVAVEGNLVRALTPDAGVLEAATDDAAWKNIAALPAHRADAALGAGPRAMVRAKHTPRAPSAREASRLAVGKRVQEDPILRVVVNFERSLAEDTVRNEYGFHRKIHEWFDAGVAEAGDVDALNEKVYAELFLTPGSDPWLGLVQEDVYVALEGE